MNPHKMGAAPTVEASPVATVRIARHGAHVTHYMASMGEGTHPLYSAATVAQLEAEIRRLRGGK